MTILINIPKILQYWGTPFITILYRCLLNREPDSEGLKYYLNRLEQGVNRFNIIEQFLKSPEVQVHFSRQELLLIRLELLQLKARYTSGFLPVARIFSQSFTAKQRIMLNRLNELQYHIDHSSIPHKQEFMKVKPIVQFKAFNKIKSSDDHLQSLSAKEKKLFKKIYNQF
ncbi:MULTISPECIES: DUF4214 domain-containing protein [Acinetobacter]|jgi:hypothetical protein|uniref:DUF4214 domain-containing protein n=1 Tax=Acinetobacter chengduensis TaxID=2420890 RepID=A0ABX9TX91_9GAMM|nr:MULTISPECIES: DUF4214 domain-containing protein [Acinetobacter]MBI1450686.1 DUF4214 domain-containing protein [Acinetobacter sp. FL51]RKG40770.1 DUF4214 domain-containing protein [Acinetobacter sp. WCHAc060007]RLL22174.1 DUF4214 domain-containing protein [Acinetobacter chengduensis]